MNKIFILKGLDCPNCSAKIENDVNKMQDVKTAAINLLKQTITIESDAEIEGLKDKLEKIVHRYEPDVDVLMTVMNMNMNTNTTISESIWNAAAAATIMSMDTSIIMMRKTNSKACLQGLLRGRRFMWL